MKAVKERIDGWKTDEEAISSTLSFHSPWEEAAVNTFSRIDAHHITVSSLHPRVNTSLCENLLLTLIAQRHLRQTDHIDQHTSVPLPDSSAFEIPPYNLIISHPTP